MSVPGGWCRGLPIAFGFGIVLYFTAEREPDAVGGAGLLAATVVAAAFLRGGGRSPFRWRWPWQRLRRALPPRRVKRAIIAHPVLQAAAWNVEVTGFVEVREERERSDRIVVRVHSIERAAGRTNCPTACGSRSARARRRRSAAL